MKASKFLLCSNCFTNFGLRFEAIRLGVKSSTICKRCKSKSGAKLNRKKLEDLVDDFFVMGSRIKTPYGGAPLIKFNPYQYQRNKSEVDFLKFLARDARLIENSLKVGFFYYGPRLWMLGNLTPLEKLRSRKSRLPVIQEILLKFPRKHLSRNDFFFRLRKNPRDPTRFSEYDAPSKGAYRFGRNRFPVLYGSQDREICIHECRVTLADNLFIAVLKPRKKLTFLDLTNSIEESGSEFESLNIAIHFLFRAESHSYEICRDLAKMAENHGFDGIIFPSYFSQIKPNLIPNIAVFGRPIHQRKVSVECINRVLLNNASYKYGFGPTLK